MTHDINQYIDTKIDHLNEKPAEEKAHIVKISKGSLLESIAGCEEFDVNTAHKEAIVETTNDVVINAISEDGIIEGIELPAYNFAIGVQWHPEFFMEKNDPSFKIFNELVNKSRKAA